MSAKIKEFYMFYKPPYGEIRACYHDGQVWFTAKHLAETLGYKSPEEAVTRLVGEEERFVEWIKFEGKKRKAKIINEAGMYSMIFRSKLEYAKPVKHWIMDEIMPLLKSGKKPDPIY